MAQINGGKVTYGRTVKTGDYENKRVDVELSFSVDEGEKHDEVLNTAAQLAVSKAHEVLGFPQKSTVTTEVNEKGEPVIKRKPGRPPSVEKTGVVAQASTDVASVVVENPTQPTASSVASVTEPEKSSTAVSEKTASSSGQVSDPAAVTDEGWEQPAEITDKDITAALQKKNADIKNPMAIKKLIGHFAGVGKFAADIPQAKRREFLTQLAALTTAST